MTTFQQWWHVGRAVGFWQKVREEFKSTIVEVVIKENRLASMFRALDEVS